MQKGIQWYTLAMAAFFTVAVLASYSDKTDPVSNGLNHTLPQIIKPVNLDRDFSFAGEPVPMDNFDVRERLDRELLSNTYWQSNTILNIKGTYRYFPLMEKILRENDVPDDFKYLAVAESSLRNAVSGAGARGIWQFMPNTAKGYGLEVNDDIDERYHVEKATEAFCRYIKDYKKRFGTWTNAAGAYNMGGTKMAKEIAVQRVKNYYDLNLNSETSRYVFRLIAFKAILEDPRNFGFYLDDKDGYAPIDNYKTVEVKDAVANWGDFAAEHGTTYRMLKVYNPWLISEKLTNKEKKTYAVKIPK